MNFFDSVKKSFKNHFDKKAEDREFIERLRFEANVKQKMIFEEEFKKNAFEVAKARAYKEAAEKSGLQKLRATNRARNLANNSNQDPGSFFAKLQEYTHKTKARREENLKRTAEMRKEAEKIRNERLQKRSTLGNINNDLRKPFKR